MIFRMLPIPSLEARRANIIWWDYYLFGAGFSAILQDALTNDISGYFKGDLTKSGLIAQDELINKMFLLMFMSFLRDYGKFLIIVNNTPVIMFFQISTENHTAQRDLEKLLNCTSKFSDAIP